METGTRYKIEHIVQTNETADILGSGGLGVYATPAMICLMEKTAYECAFNQGLPTVGTRLEISHLKACLPGKALTAECELIEVEGRRLSFNVKVVSGDEIIGEGRHDRFVIDPERFMSKLK